MKFFRSHLVVLVFAVVLAVHSFGCDKGESKPEAAVPTPAVPPSSAVAMTPVAPSAAVASDAPHKPVAAPNSRKGWPTEDEAKATILKIEYAINASETNKSVWHVKDFRHEVKSVKFAAETTQKQMKYGAAAMTVYPVKIVYTQVTDYAEKPTTRVEAGADGVWYFYKDSFGEWTAKYGSD